MCTDPQRLGRAGPGRPAGPLEADAPLLAAFLAAAGRDDAPFSVPGHKRRTGALDRGLGLVTDADVPLYEGTRYRGN